jgi:hypothetical protein
LLRSPAFAPFPARTPTVAVLTGCWHQIPRQGPESYALARRPLAAGDVFSLEDRAGALVGLVVHGRV